MTMPHRLAPVLLLALIAPLPALAQNGGSVPTAGTTDDKGWSGTGELGLAISKGNTDNETFVGKFQMDYSDPKWKHQFGGNYQYGKDDDEENANRYELFGTTGYRFGERTYTYGSVRNERDHFTDDEYQWTVGVGLGWEAVKTERQQLTLEAGPGYRWSKDQGVQVHHDEVIGRGYADYGVQLTETTSFYDTLLVESGADNTFAKNQIGLQVKMTEALALKAGLETRHNTEVEPGVKKTDNLTTVNVVYAFK
jgi:putative salt-induced outer membrane protein